LRDMVEKKTIDHIHGAPPEHLRINLGSGLNTARGWVNVDKSFGPWLTRHPFIKRGLRRMTLLSEDQFEARWPAEVLHLNVTKGLPWPDGSVEAIYSSHMLEHLDQAKAQQLLQECHRVLTTGGIIRIVVPDLLRIAMSYMRDKERGHAVAANQFLNELYLTPEFKGSRLHAVAMRKLHAPHRWMYDYESMAELLLSLGFTDIVREEYREGTCPDLGSLETRPDSLFVEARKP
jgi:predicted SAM-dependent methyltransferase